MRVFAVLVFTFLCCLLSVSAETNMLFQQKAGVCDYNAINGKLVEVQQIVSNINDSTSNVLPLIIAAANTIIPTTSCLAQIGTWVKVGQETVTKYTDTCVHTDKTSNAYKADPCCNRDLEEKQCCMPKNVTYTREKISSFSSGIESACSQPSKAKNLISTFFSNYQTRIPQCTTEVERKIKKDFEMLHRMVKCWYRVFTETDDCTANSDCDGGNGFCDITKGKCAPIGTESYKPLLRCVFGSIPSWVKRIFRLKLGIKGADSEAALQAAFAKYTAKEECYTPVLGNNFVFTKSSLLNTQAKCLFAKSCNIATDQGKCTTNKCAAICGLNKICSTDVSSVFKTKTQCDSYGYCMGNGFANANGVLYNSTTCAQQNYCTAYAQCNENTTPKCTKALCEAKGRCLGFPLTQTKCVLDFKLDASTGQKTCGVGEDQQDFGCISAKGSIDCASSGGKMISVPTSETECLQYKHCVNNNTRIITHMTSETCGMCGGTYESAFKWVPAQWKQSFLYQPQKWTIAAQVPTNRWVTGVDVLRLTKLITSVILLQTISAYRSMIQCAYVPLVKITHTIACDCGTPKAPNGTNCYQPISTPVATFKVFAGLKHKSQSSDVDVTVSANAVSSSQDYVEAEVVKTDATTVTGSQDLLVVFDTQSTATGYLASDGFAVQKQGGGSLGGTTNLCIKRSVQNVPAEYTVAGFATVSNGVIYRSSVTITNKDYSLEMCGDVTDTRTYYMAFFKPGTPVSNNSHKYALSAVAVILAVIVALFA
eukprot:gene2766-4174_t